MLVEEELLQPDPEPLDPGVPEPDITKDDTGDEPLTM